MTGLVGTWRLVRLLVRLDRVRLSVWIVALAGFPAMVASAFANLYPAEAARAELVGTVASAPALVALLGPVNGTSIGALTAWRIGTIGAVLVAFMAAFTVIRHTRQDEETGRRELLGSTVVGRHAPLVAALVGAVGAGAAIAVGVVAGLVGQGEDVAGAVAFGLSWLLVAAAFAGVGALSAQLTASASGARGIAGGAIGVAFVLRMAGDGGADSGLGWLTWGSPIGWASKLRPFGGEQWWVLLLLVGFAAGVTAVAFALSVRRDVGSGIAAPTPGPASAAPDLSSAWGLARRLQTRSFVGWLVGVGVFGALWGVLADTINALFEENPQLADLIERLGRTGTLTDTFFGAAFGILAVIVAAYATTTTLTLHREEEAMRAEPVLATATPRLAWSGGHLAFAFLGPAVLMSAAAVAAGITYGVVVDDVAGTALSLLDSAWVQLPAIWVMAAVALALYGRLPDRVGFSWGILVLFLLLGQLGQILQLPQWALDVSPFTHVPVPPATLRLLPLAVLAAVAAALGAVGLTGLRRRDLG